MFKSVVSALIGALTIGVGLQDAGAATNGSVALTEKDQCASCGMWIQRYPGPKGEIVFEDGSNLKYCSARGMACEYLKLDSAAQAKVKGLFAHNTQGNDWKKPDDALFIDAKTAWYVYGSSMKAVMGPSLAPFAQRRAAEQFQKQYGGKLYRFEDLTKEILGCKQHN